MCHSQPPENVTPLSDRLMVMRAGPLVLSLAMMSSKSPENPLYPPGSNVNGVDKRVWKG